MADFEILPWDTAFFGFPVARIEAAVISEEGVARALNAMRRQAVRLCYWMPEQSEENARIARNLNGDIVGAIARYERDLEGVTPLKSPADIRIALCAIDDVASEMLRLARGAGRLSRFATDRRMPAGTADRMYEIWIRRSISRDIADAVLFARGRSDAIVGLVTIVREQDDGVIGLVAVDQGHRRAGIGRALTQAAMAYLIGIGAKRVRVTTQGENTAACELYEACGFTRVRLELAVHFWI